MIFDQFVKVMSDTREWCVLDQKENGVRSANKMRWNQIPRVEETPGFHSYSEIRNVRRSRYSNLVWRMGVSKRIVCAVLILIHINIVTEIHFWFKSVCVYFRTKVDESYQVVFVVVAKICAVSFESVRFLSVKIVFKSFSFSFWFFPSN